MSEKFSDNIKDRKIDEALEELVATYHDFEAYIKWINIQKAQDHDNEQLERVLKDAHLAIQFTFDTLIELDEYKQEQEGEKYNDKQA